MVCAKFVRIECLQPFAAAFVGWHQTKCDQCLHQIVAAVHNGPAAAAFRAARDAEQQATTRVLDCVRR